MSKSTRNIGHVILGLFGAIVGVILASATLLAGVLGTGLAVGRAVDLLQGAQPRLLSDWTMALDGWAVLFAAYVLLWLPVTALARAIRRDVDPRLPEVEDDG